MSNFDRSDSVRCIKETNSIPISAYTATVTGAAVNIYGCGPSVGIVIRTGTISAADGSNFMTFTVLQGTTDAAADAVDSSQYDAANGWDKVINATTEGNATYRINFIVKPEYDWLKIVATETGTFNGTFGAWIEYMPSIQPVLAT